jgi:hypothetical protein
MEWKASLLSAMLSTSRMPTGHHDPRASAWATIRQPVPGRSNDKSPSRGAVPWKKVTFALRLKHDDLAEGTAATISGLRPGASRASYPTVRIGDQPGDFVLKGNEELGEQGKLPASQFFRMSAP